MEAIPEAMTGSHARGRGLWLLLESHLSTSRVLRRQITGNALQPQVRVVSCLHAYDNPDSRHIYCHHYRARKLRTYSREAFTEMHWSKLKQRIEELFSPSLRGRVELRSTWYRDGGRSSSRLWITVDGNEIYQFSSPKTAIAQIRLACRIADADSNGDFHRAAQEVRPMLEKQGLYTFEQAHTALQNYLSLSLEEALQSDNLVIRSLAVLDRRLGKRRLATLRLRTDEHPLVKQLYAFRCTAENLTLRRHPKGPRIN
jgi:hypothetical protein